MYVNAGERNDKRYFIKDEGEQQPYRRSGDVVVLLKVLPHNTFERIGEHLYITIRLTLKEALLGFKREYTGLNGRKFTIETNEITQPKSVRVYSGFGMKRVETSGYGNLYATFEVEFPAYLSSDIANEIASVLK